jgi:hypothetical protein
MSLSGVVEGTATMKDRLRDLLSEVGESFDYLRDDVRNLGRYLAELEALVEGYQTFAANAHLSPPADLTSKKKLLKQTQKVMGPPPPEGHASGGQDVEKIAGNLREG